MISVVEREVVNFPLHYQYHAPPTFTRGTIPRRSACQWSKPHWYTPFSYYTTLSTSLSTTDIMHHQHLQVVLFQDGLHVSGLSSIGIHHSPTTPRCQLPFSTTDIMHHP